MENIGARKLLTTIEKNPLVERGENVLSTVTMNIKGLAVDPHYLELCLVAQPRALRNPAEASASS